MNNTHTHTSTHSSFVIKGEKKKIKKKLHYKNVYIFESGSVSFQCSIAPSRWQQGEKVVTRGSDIFQEVGGSAKAVCPKNVFQSRQWESDYHLRCFDDSLENFPVCLFAVDILHS